MTKLGIEVGSHKLALFHIDSEPLSITVREGPASVRLHGDWGQLPHRTSISGRLIFGADRVYGRMTEARTPDGRFPVCLELFPTDLKRRGLEREPDGGPDTPRVWSSVFVKAVDRFE
jgi:hypothetical protein